jgi:hypothetical protein
MSAEIIFLYSIALLTAVMGVLLLLRIFSRYYGAKKNL